MNEKTTRDALVVCITQYADLKMSAEMTALAQGAEEIAQLLETKGGFRVKRLPVTKLDNEKEFIDSEQMVMAEELKLAIEQLLIPKSDTPPTTALIYFAGHGLQKEINADRYEGFLASSYANPDENKWDISLPWLRQLLEQSPVQQQIVWIDTCHSGELFNFTAHDSVHDRCFISSARAYEEAYAEGVLTKALLETLDYTKQLNPWVDHLTLTEGLKIENKKAVGSQRFMFDNTDKPIILTNKAFDLEADYKNVCPFKGLESFDFEKNPDDAFYFKGRTQLTNELLEKVQSANFLAVLGASGNGKSSVVRAGLLYSIRQTQRWQILPVITPTAEPLKALGTIIGMPAEQLSDFINLAQTERQVLVIDQFEEIFTLCKNNAEREQFFAILLAAIERADNQFCLIIVMRADFLDKCSHHVDLAKQIQSHQIIVTPMTPAELEEAIVAPTQQVGLQIEPKLVSEMLADVKGALGSLPLLQYTLTELWKKCATQRLLTFSAYEELGKIAGTLEQGANGVYQKLSPAEQKTAQRIFIELTQLGEGTPDTRRQLSQQDLVTSLPFESAPVGEVIQKLVEANLVVTDKPKEEQVAVVNIAHEALTQHWGQLRGWLDGNRDAIKIQRNIEADAKKWQDSNQSKNALLQGLDLNIAKDYAETHTEKVPLSTLALDFVQRSIKRQRQYWQTVIGSVVGVMLVLAGIAYYANEQRIVAEHQETIAISGQLGAQAIAIQSSSSTNGYLDRSLLLGIQAFNIINTPEAQGNLLHVLQNTPSKLDFYLRGHSGITDIAFSPDGKLLASASQDKSVILWDVDKQLPLGQPLEHDEEVHSVAFSHDGKFLASGFQQNNVTLWDISNRIIIGQFLQNRKKSMLLPVNNLAFSRDNKLLLSESEHTAILWDVASQKPLQQSPLYYTAINDIAFSPDGKFLAVSNYGYVGLWGINQIFIEQPLHTISNKKSWGDITFSTDSKLLAGNSTDRIWLWHVANQAFIGQFGQGQRWEGNISFSYNNKILAAVNYEFNNVILWDVSKQVPIGKPLQGGHTTSIQKVIFRSNSSNQLATLGFDDIIILWDIDHHIHPIGQLLQKKTVTHTDIASNSNYINTIAFSPNGKLLANGSKDGSVILWDMSTQTPTKQLLKAHRSRVFSVTFNQNSKLLASGSADGTVILWDTTTRTPIGQPLQGYKEADDVYSVAFSPDGKLLANSGYHSFVLWDVVKRTVGEAFLGHKNKAWVSVNSVAFSPNSKLVASAARDGIVVSNVNDQTPIGQILSQSEEASSVAFSPDGKLLAATVSDGFVTLWDVSTQTVKQQLKGHKSSYSIAFSPNGKRLASSGDNNVILWDLTTYTAIGQPLKGHTNIVVSVAFSPDGKLLASKSKDGMIMLWDVDLQSWLKKACRKAGRNLTQKEWKRYLPNKPYQKTCPQYPPGK